MIAPEYQEQKDSEIKRATKDGVSVKVIAGSSMGVTSNILTKTPTMYLDFKLEPNSKFVQPVPKGWNAFIFIIKGEGVFGQNSKRKSSEHHTLVLDDGDFVEFANTHLTEILHLVLIAGEPINEPIVQHGPFVMNTKEEIMKTFDDFRSAKNGFEKAANWKSKIGNRH
jgi:quercetin 2,3-dioxygenase